MTWSRADLENLVREFYADHHFLVVSNREPYEHVLRESRVEARRPPGGVITGLDPVVRAAGGTWVAAASGNADRQNVDENDRVRVPPDGEAYTLRRIFLSKEEMNGYYYGFANEALWPLCHVAYQRPRFDTHDWEQYVKVNKKFADVVLEEVGSGPAVVFVQDYHLALFPQFLKEARPDILIAHFWHIPWPNPEAFRICPERKDILHGLLGNNLLGFHIPYHCNNFLDTVACTIEARTDRDRMSIFYHGHETLIRAFPISVDYEALNASAAEEPPGLRDRLRSDFGLAEKLVVSVDRIDYTKGIPERLYAIDRFLESHPQFCGRVTFLMVGALSRMHLKAYKDLNDEINSLIEEVNWKHAQDSWAPVVLTRRHVPYQEILTLYRMADAVVVSSLHDGMNLVAKEFASCRSDGHGVLVISRFAGAAQELEGALQVNPYDRADLAEAIAAALLMPKKEQQQRMEKLRETVQENNIYRWAGKILQEMARL